MLQKNNKSLLEQFQVCIFAEIVFGVRCALNILCNLPSFHEQYSDEKPFQASLSFDGVYNESQN